MTYRTASVALPQLTFAAASVFVTITLLFTFCPALHAQDVTEPLQLTLTCEQASGLNFRLSFRNISTAPVAAVLGSTLRNGKHLLGPLRFTLSRPGAADINFYYLDPTAGVVGGTVDRWVVSLPVGATYSIPISIPKGFRDSFSTPAEMHAHLTTVDPLLETFKRYDC